MLTVASGGPSSVGKGARHLNAVDGLRAFAVLTVLAFHLRNSILPGGFTGVDVFFTISGYVVSLALMGHTAERLGTFLSAFYLRRTARIYPALLVMLLTIGVVSALFLPRAVMTDANDATGSLAFWGLSNWGLVNLGDNYFSPTTDFNPFTHTWSLAVEEQFYLVFSPIAFLALRSLASVRTRWANSILPALCLASLGYSIWASLSHSVTAYYYLPSRFWELGAGALLLQAHTSGRLLPRTVAAQGRCALGGMALLVLSVVFADPHVFPFPWAIPAVAGTALFISAAAVPADLGETRTPVLRFFASPPVVFVGLISYSLYLWHWPLIVLARWTYGLQGASYAVVALGTLGLAALSYRVVETPLKRAFRRSARPGVALALSLVVVYTCQRVYRSATSRLPRHSLSVTQGSDWHVDGIPPEGLAASPAKVWGRHSIYVLGDSHAYAYSGIFIRLNESYGPHVRLFSKGGCAVPQEAMPNADPVCRDFISESFGEVVKDAQPGDVVFLPALRVARLSEQWAENTEADRTGLQKGAAWVVGPAGVEETGRVLDRLEKAGVTVVMDAPPPVFPAPAFRCADWYDRDNPVCRDGTTVSRRFFEEWRRPAMSALEELRRRHPKLMVWDPLDALCPSSVCSALDAGGRPLFFDGDHLSSHGDDVLVPSFVRLLSSVWSR